MHHQHLTDVHAVPRNGGAGRYLAVETVTAILTEFAGGKVAQKELAARYGVTCTTIHKIVADRSHRSAPGPRLPADRVAQLGLQRSAEGRRLAAKRATKATCPGCGEGGHRITRCPNPRER